MLMGINVYIEKEIMTILKVWRNASKQDEWGLCTDGYMVWVQA